MSHPERLSSKRSISTPQGGGVVRTSTPAATSASAPAPAPGTATAPAPAAATATAPATAPATASATAPATTSATAPATASATATAPATATATAAASATAPATASATAPTPAGPATPSRSLSTVPVSRPTSAAPASRPPTAASASTAPNAAPTTASPSTESPSTESPSTASPTSPQKTTTLAQKDDADKRTLRVSSRAEFDTLLTESGKKHLLLEFYAVWCGSCMMINSKIEELANLYHEKITFVRIDIDDLEEVAVEYGVSMMPSFVVIKEKQVLETFAGSSHDQLEQMVKKYSGETPNTSELQVDT